MRVEIPRLRMWHLLGLVAAAAAFLSVMDFRQGVEDPTYLLIKKLRSVDADERRYAVMQLQVRGKEARAAIEPLIEALDDGDPKVRGQAAMALVSILTRGTADPQAAAVKSALTASLQDRDPGARHRAAVSLMMLEPEAKETLPILIDALHDPDAEVRDMATFHTAQFMLTDPRAKDAIFSAMSDEAPRVRASAIRAAVRRIRSIPPELLPEISRAVQPALKDQEAFVRSSAVMATGSLMRVGAADIGPIVEALADPDAQVRMMAAYSFPKGEYLSENLPALGKALADPDDGVRRNVISSLIPLGADAEPALPALQGAARDDKSPDIRKLASEACAKIEAKSREFKEKILPSLLADLTSENTELRRQATELAGISGPRAKAALPALIKALDDPDAEVRRNAAIALGRFGSLAKDAVPALTARADDQDGKVRNAAKAALKTIQKGAEKAPRP